MPQIVPVILSGGSGSRLWPQSREKYPKQMLALASERTLIQDSALRTAGDELFARPLIVCNEEQRFIVAEQMRTVSVAPASIIVEPMARNTAPAIAAAALSLADSSALMLVAPADHLITDRVAFVAAIKRGAAAARAGRIVTFGMTPTFPETGYGYIRRGAATANEGVFDVSQFVEKPNLETAEAYLSSGEFFWNSGIFLASAKVLLQELEAFQPELLLAARQAVSGASRDLDFLRLDAEGFSGAPNISIDYAVMERTSLAVVVPAHMGWTDIGSWSALWDVAEHDSRGNALVGDVIAEDCDNCYVDSAGQLTAILGLEDTVVVVTPDATLVAAKHRTQDVRRIVDRLKRDKRREASKHLKEYRVWGHYDTLQEAQKYEVRHVRLLPSASLTMQKHDRRAEHWVIVSGLARVTCDGRTVELGPNQSTYIPPGSFHRLENALDDTLLNMIEVRTGSYLGEDDIVRVEEDKVNG
jgi:mannose-1-phosphate guanylyltransferase/mannose-1-phosphate guanylyltransferase/mannose-6-phosphate isomerase